MKKIKIELPKKLAFSKKSVLQLNQLQSTTGGGDTIFQCVSNACGSMQDTHCAGTAPTIVVACPPQPPVSVPYTCAIESHVATQCCVIHV